MQTPFARATALALAALALSACARSEVIQTARNQALITTNAAPACGTRGAMRAANQTAAVATLRAGYERYVIAGAGAQNNTSTFVTGPTYASTTGTFNTFGNTTYGSMNTVYGGQQIWMVGTNDAQLQVIMFNRGEPGFDQAIDARATLGPDWEANVRDGVQTCS